MLAVTDRCSRQRTPLTSILVLGGQGPRPLMARGAKTVGGQESIPDLIWSVLRMSLDFKPRRTKCSSGRTGGPVDTPLPQLPHGSQFISCDLLVFWSKNLPTSRSVRMARRGIT
ncbi:hypothetical protein CORC01_12081 [Colletotrichum orchidophilum]|uniref:Uncharacterized protein n=1 Tax=Colletotrichum orchidophilum TaxID=1209926 RepID=A0A1G4AU53_9PEZI|nr:uncharacterized protein CORC01_12081 [Colletotrichum orchidophilum]OHE92635.1 hypothetical protein CORC01_12081 [Colletotrichum orchidophilum]